MIICNGRYLIQFHSQVLIQTDVSRKGWSAVCQWTSREVKGGTVVTHKCVSMCSKISMFDLQQTKIFESSLFPINSITALLYIVKTGRTGNQMLMKLSREIWQYLLKHQIKIPAEYFTSSLNVEADWSKHQGPIRMETLPKSISTRGCPK